MNPASRLSPALHGIMPAVFFALVQAGPVSAHPDPAHSLAELDRHISETPDDPVLHLRRAELLIRRNHPERARPSVAKALQLAPDNPDVSLLRTRLAISENRRADALRHARETTSRFPGFPAGWEWLARIHRESGDMDAAIAAKKRHLSFQGAADPGDHLTAASWLRERNGSGDIGMALRILDEGISRFGPMMALQKAAIPLEISLSRHEQALARVGAMVAKYGPAASFSLLRADIFEAAGRHAEAAAACDSAAALLDAGGAEPEETFAELRAKILTRKDENLTRAEEVPALLPR